jgi:hypothetical protein
MRALLATCVVVAAACGENRTPPGAPPDAGALACLPDLDGRITAGELPDALAGAARYYVSTDVEVDLAGDSAWDLSEERAGDDVVTITAGPVAGRWYADDAPAADFAISEPDGTDGLYARDDAGVYLVGVASTDEDPDAGRTLLVYEQPVLLLRFPLADGDRHTATGTVTGGELLGLPYSGTDSYEVEVAGAGELHLPYVRFAPALRVRTAVTSEPAAGGVSITRRQTSFYFECSGELARAVSRAGETEADFTVAAELRRFAL